MPKPAADTRQHILRAALSRFAEKGYAGTSVQEIVDAASVAKPALYYYFKNKADLYMALLDWAFEERYRLMEEAVAKGGRLAAQLTEICATSFEFIRKNRELMRLAFATSFAGRGEVPPGSQCIKRGKRSFDYIQTLIEQGVARGELGRHFDPQEMALGFVGMMNFHVMVFLIGAGNPLDRRAAERIVELFLAGARHGLRSTVKSLKS
jgi:TetR/AcrR family transcriptional regulator